MDIDIDFLNRSTALQHLKHITACRTIDNEQQIAHNTGVYFHKIPVNPLNNISTINYKEAEQRGYFKIDFLNVTAYTGVKNNDHLLSLMEDEPIWELLLNEKFVNLLFHLNGHSDILTLYHPTSVEQLAAVLAMIRPAKRYLIGKDWTTVMKEIWIKPKNNSYYFKKSHSFSYAFAIIVQMNLLCEQIESGTLIL